MNAFACFPEHLHWNAQQLVDAVPLRLSELFRYDRTLDRDLPAAANHGARTRRAVIGYLSRPALHPRFAVR